MRVLVANAGSSTLKLSVVESGHRHRAVTVDGWAGAGHDEPVEEFLRGCGRIDAVGHRVVHGGPRRSGPARVDDDLHRYLRGVEELAPLHNARAVAGMEVVGRLLPRIPAGACFDTDFHAAMPAAAATYAVPREWVERWGVRRYGFHGLSHAHAVRRAAELVERPASELRVVSCHLGAGASVTAVVGGRSVDTTMGFTPLEGVVMATRSGSVDPGLLLWLQRRRGLGAAELEDALQHRSGLAGLSGTTGDMRQVLAARASGDPPASLAFDVYILSLRKAVSAMTCSAEGADVVVFTGGVGERSSVVRAAVCTGLGHVGVSVDEAANRSVEGDAEISGEGARTRTVVVTAAEDLEIARQVEALLDR